MAENMGISKLSSPTTCVYCWELECAVKVESMSTAQRRAAINCKRAVVALGRNFKRQILLKISLTNVKGIDGLCYLLKDCKLHGKTIAKGSASIEIPSKQLAIFLSNCAPRKLSVFMKTLDAKLTLMSESESTQLHGTPSVCTRKELLQGIPEMFTELSPLTVREIIALQRNRGKGRALQEGGSTDAKSPRGSNQGTPRGIGKRRRPLADLQQTPSTARRPSSEKLMENVEMGGTQLSEEQRDVVRCVIETKQSVFFTGSAGTGKSLVLRRIIGLLPAESTFVTAATGVAACQIGGVTLHSFASIGHGERSAEECLRLASSRKFAVARWKRCQHLVIDEISMVDAEFFEKIEFVARRVRSSDEPFGGIQLILTGDFLQLPPVTKTKSDLRFCFQSEAWKRCIQKTILLREVKRQSDIEFVNILQELRFGMCSTSSSERLRATKSTDYAELGIVPTRLCTHNSDAEAVNSQELRTIQGEEKIFEAEDSEHIPDSFQFSVPKQLVLKKGAQVMLTKNIDLARGLSNGSRGVVTGFSSLTKNPLVRFVANESAIVEIRPVSFTVPLLGNETTVVRRQIPLQLAWGISIHKSQGITLDAVEMCLSNVFEHGQAYVALSRARSFAAVRLFGFTPSCVHADPIVVDYYRQLEKESSTPVGDRADRSLFRIKKRSRLNFG